MMRNASATSPISSSVSTAKLVSRSPRAIASAPACRFCSGRVMRRASTFDSTIASSSADTAPRHQRDDRAPAGGRQRFPVDRDAEQADRLSGHVLELAERDRIGVALDLERRPPSCRCPGRRW